VAHLKKINLFIAQYQSTDVDNSGVLMSVEDRNQEFLERLTKQHPDLTDGQKDLSLQLCINLSTKEISLLTGRSPKTINMNRYRLRKTLNLSSNDSLSEYLQSI
jgi:DNA-binding CsgD family transcriptional regulator